MFDSQCVVLFCSAVDVRYCYRKGSLLGFTTFNGHPVLLNEDRSVGLFSLWPCRLNLFFDRADRVLFCIKKSMKYIQHLLFTGAFVLCTLIGSAQKGKPRVSPPDSVTGMVKGATITIHYSSPSVKGRVI